MKKIRNVFILSLSSFSLLACIPDCPVERTEYVIIKNNLDAKITFDFRYPNMSAENDNAFNPIYFEETLDSGESKKVVLRLVKEDNGSSNAGAVGEKCETQKLEENQLVAFSNDTLSMYKVCRTQPEGLANSSEWEYHLSEMGGPCGEGYFDISVGYSRY